MTGSHFVFFVQAIEVLFKALNISILTLQNLCTFKNKSESIKVFTNTTARCNSKYKEMEECVHRAKAFPFLNTVNRNQNGKSGKV